ncbi:MAG: chromate resistance protein ChrB domain-containing protein [Pseudomonadota bacterium]
MTVWRKLMKSGAIPLKGSVYILPFTAEHYEFLQWLVAEVKEMSGDAALVSIDRVDTMKDEEIFDLFNQARRNDYLSLEKNIEAISRKWDAFKKSGLGGNGKSLSAQLVKFRKSFAEIQRIDFFASPEGIVLQNSLDRLHQEFQQLPGSPKKSNQIREISKKSEADYSGLIWMTRKNPFVDRMASAWLIKRFIDHDASFAFAESEEMPHPPAGTVLFDMFDGEFTHCGELCTFEVLIRSFDIKDKALRKIAEIVHDLDIKDNKYLTPEAPGLEVILAGIRKTAKSDNDALTQGMAVFEMLYASNKS